MNVSIRPCTCESAFQDATYGKGQRVHNRKQGKTDGWRCTSCKRAVGETGSAK